MSIKPFQLVLAESARENEVRWHAPLAISGVAALFCGLGLNAFLERHVFAPVGVPHDGMYLGGWPDELLPTAAFFFCVTALALVLLARWRPATWTIDVCLLVIFSFSVIATMFYGGFYFTHQFLATGTDVTGQCPAIEVAANKSGFIPHSAEVTNRPAVYCAGETYGMFMSDYDDLTIFGVTGAASQNQILSDLRAYRKSARTVPLHVGFFDKENVTLLRGRAGAVGGQLDPETLIRVATLR